MRRENSAQTALPPHTAVASGSSKRKAGTPTAAAGAKRARKQNGHGDEKEEEEEEAEQEDEAEASAPGVRRNGKVATPSKVKASTPAPSGTPAAGSSRDADVVNSKKKKKKGPQGKDAKDGGKSGGKGAAAVRVPSLSTKAKGCEVPDSSVRRLAGHNGEVFVSSWNPSVPGLLASGAADATVRIWDLSDDADDGGAPTVCKHLPATHAKDVSALDWNPDGTLLASGSYDGILRLWTPQGDLHLVMSMHQGPIFAVRWNRKGNLLLTGSADGTAIVWDLNSGKVRQQFSTHSDSVLDIDWLCGSRWATAHPGSSPSAAADGTLATCSADNSVNLLRIGESRPVRTLRGHSDEVNAIRFNASGSLLASASDDMTCRIWDMDVILGADFAAPSVAFPASTHAPQPDQAASKAVLRGHTKELYAVAWAPPGSQADSARLVATSSFDRTARLWNADDGSCIRTFAEHTDSVYAICFSPDARYMATGGIDQRVYVTRVDVSLRNTDGPAMPLTHLSAQDGTIVKAYAGGGGVMDLSWHLERSGSALKRSASDGETHVNGRSSSSRADAMDEDGAPATASGAANASPNADASKKSAPTQRLAVAQSDRALVVLDLSELD
jgi:transducin (beta)-like 1